MPNSKFDALTTEQQEFLISYVKHRGDIHQVSKELAIPGKSGYEITYNANMIMLDVQRTLGVPDTNYENYIPTWPYTSIQHPKASDIVRAAYHHNKLSHGFYAPLICYPSTRDYHYVYAYCMDTQIDCDKKLFSGENQRMPETYRYKVLDMIVDFLIKNRGFAQKGSQSGNNAYADGTIAAWYKRHILDNSRCKGNEGRLSVYYVILKAAGIIADNNNSIHLTDKYCSLLQIIK